MKLLKDFLLLPEGNDLSELPEDTMKDIQSNIRKGAADLEQEWANALELVHQAYKVSNVQRPTPDMQAAWKQYEENLQYAVQQLAKTRGIEGDWRMSASVFEQAEGLKTFQIEIRDAEGSKTVFVKAQNTKQIVDKITEESDKKVKAEKLGNKTHLTFWMHGIRSSQEIFITPTK